ncbi:MAG: type II secretion system protein N [Magnetococcus sp. YQC-9]
MSGWRGQVLFGLLCYGVFLVAKMPASWAYERLAFYLSPLRVGGLTGTIGSGAFSELAWGTLRLGSGKWRVVPESLLAGRLGVDVVLGVPGAAMYATGRVGIAGVSALFAEGVTVEVDIEPLRVGLGMIPPGSRGRIAGRLETLLADRQGVRVVRGHGAGVGLHLGSPLNVELGDLSGELQPDEGRGVLVRLADRAGPWLVRLTIGVKPDGGFRARGQVAARDGTDQRAMNLLRVLGPVDGQGWVRIDERGRLPGW